MTKYHLQVRYCLCGWEDNIYTEKDILGWTNIEDAPSFTEMQKYKKEGKLLQQWLRMISDDEERCFDIGHNVQKDYPYMISDLHKTEAL